MTRRQSSLGGRGHAGGGLLGGIVEGEAGEGRGHDGLERSGCAAADGACCGLGDLALVVVGFVVDAPVIADAEASGGLVMGGRRGCLPCA